jgi:hypothetical protein
VYAPLAPAPDLRSYDNFQSLWQQPLLPEQQTAPSRAYGIHVVFFFEAYEHVIFNQHFFF